MSSGPSATEPVAESSTDLHPPDLEPPGPVTSDGRPRRAVLSVPALGIHNLPVVPYKGWTDDAPGTRIQDRGVAASPFGPRGGVGPGGVGNYQVTAHRTSSTQAFLDLPALRRGERIVVRDRTPMDTAVCGRTPRASTIPPCAGGTATPPW